MIRNLSSLKYDSFVMFWSNPTREKYSAACSDYRNSTNKDMWYSRSN